MEGMKIFWRFSPQFVATRIPVCDKGEKHLQNVSHGGKKTFPIIIFW
jgi:hypothetical protein